MVRTAPVGLGRVFPYLLLQLVLFPSLIVVVGAESLRWVLGMAGAGGVVVFGLVFMAVLGALFLWAFVAGLLFLLRGACCRRTVSFDRTAQTMELEERYPWGTRSRLIELAQVREARRHEPPQHGGDPCARAYLYGVKVEFDGGWFPLPCEDRTHQAWLIASMNSFLESARGRK
jgi:hypothetical protein